MCVLVSCVACLPRPSFVILRLQFTYAFLRGSCCPDVFGWFWCVFAAYIYILRLQCTCFGGGVLSRRAVFVDSRVSLWRISRLQSNLPRSCFFFGGSYLVGLFLLILVCMYVAFIRPVGIYSFRRHLLVPSAFIRPVDIYSFRRHLFVPSAVWLSVCVRRNTLCEGKGRLG